MTLDIDRKKAPPERWQSGHKISKSDKDLPFDYDLSGLAYDPDRLSPSGDGDEVRAAKVCRMRETEPRHHPNLNYFCKEE